MSFEYDFAPYSDGDAYDEMDVRFGWDLRNHEVHCLTMALRKAEAERDALKAINAELLDVLIKVKAWDISNNSLDIPLDIRKAMQSAIAKATGEQQ